MQLSEDEKKKRKAALIALMQIASEGRNVTKSIRTNKHIEKIAAAIQKKYGLYGTSAAYVLALLCFALKLPPEDVIRALELDKKKHEPTKSVMRVKRWLLEIENS